MDTFADYSRFEFVNLFEVIIRILIWWNVQNNSLANYEQIRAATQTEVNKIAVVGAITDLLVIQAVSRGTDVYMI
jgi:hypothetical protein